MPSDNLRSNLYKKYTDIMPKGAGVLFFIQMFSTLAFSALYSTLVLYITTGLKLSDYTATNTTASFIAFNYALHLLGGYLGGRFLSYRLLFCVGMFSQILGCILLSLHSLPCFFWGLAAFLTGSGLNITCINCMLTQLFSPSDKRREAAFLWNYSGMNVGFFIGFGLSGYFQLHNAYAELFLISSLGNVIALIIAFIKWPALRDINTYLTTASLKAKYKATLWGFGFIALLLLALRWLLEHALFSNNLILATGMVMLVVISYLALRQTTREARNKVFAYIILAFTSLVFWTLYQLAPMGLTLFIERNVDRHILGWMIAPQWVQNINTIVIIIGGPTLSFVFTKLRDWGINLTIPVQFSIALLFIGAAFAILPIGIIFADAQGLSNINWIIASFILQSIGELFISPIGYAMVGQFAPQHLQGLMMGTWLMISGVAAVLSGYFSTLALGKTFSMEPLITNQSFSFTFAALGILAILTGLLLCFLIPWVLKLTQERKIFAATQLALES